MYLERLQSNLRDSSKVKAAVADNEHLARTFAAATEQVVRSYQNGGRLFIAGNGGSAADAQHLAAEFISKLVRPRAPLPAEALTVDTSILTAIGNDFGFEHIFSRQLDARAAQGDVFLALTTSGMSQNILKALELCRQKGIPSIVFTGESGGLARDLADFCICVPSFVTSRIQEVHEVLFHTLCECVEAELFPV